MPSFTNRKGRLTASRIFNVDFEIIPPAGICCTAMSDRGGGARHRVRWSPAAILFAVAILAPPATAIAGDRTNIPLKNWGGFAEFRDAVYDDLERLVTAGLADRTLLNTKPLSRIEAARIVARAIQKIRADEAGDFNGRRDLEPVLDRLMEEFKVELAGLGVKLPDGAQPPGFVSFTPIDRFQVSSQWTNHKLSLVNEQGRTLQQWLSGGPTFESRQQIGDFL